MKNKTNSKGNTVYCERLLSIFKEIDEKNISSYEQLQEYKHVDLFAELWVAMRDWINNVPLKSQTSNDGKEPGNLYKIEGENGIIASGIADLLDIQSDCLARVMKYMNTIISNPPEARKPYCVKTVNTVVNELGRKVKKNHAVTMISLQENAKGKKVSAEDSCAYENLIGDNRTPANIHSLHEDINEGKALLLSKLEFLSKDSCRTLAFLSGHLNINPRVIAKLLLKKGIEATFDAMRKYTAETCEIPITELKKIVNTENLKRDPFKVSSNDEKIIADKISHLRNYGNDIISKKF